MVIACTLAGLPCPLEWPFLLVSPTNGHRVSALALLETARRHAVTDGGYIRRARWHAVVVAAMRKNKAAAFNWMRASDGDFRRRLQTATSDGNTDGRLSPTCWREHAGRPRVYRWSCREQMFRCETQRATSAAYGRH